MKKVILLGSVLQKDKDGKDIYLCTGSNGEIIWSYEKLVGGTAVMIDERKVGDEYVDRKTGETKKVQFNHNQLRVVVGDVAAMQNIKLAKAALAEMD